MVEEAAEQVAGAATEGLGGAAENRLRHVSKALPWFWWEYAVDPAHVTPSRFDRRRWELFWFWRKYAVEHAHAKP